MISGEKLKHWITESISVHVLAAGEPALMENRPSHEGRNARPGVKLFSSASLAQFSSIFFGSQAEISSCDLERC